MATFEDILRDSAQRSIRQHNAKLDVPQNPVKSSRTYWGWIATPAAAVVGIIFGMSLPFLSNQSDNTLAQQADTVKVTTALKDTVYLTQVKTLAKHDTVYLSVPAKEKSSRPELAIEPQCTSIQCDGIDYALLSAN